jgi:ABC-type amino acid transport substrate-binding protein
MPSSFKILAQAAFLVLLTAGQALAQTSGIPEQLFNTTRPQQGDTIRFCIDQRSIGAKFDHAVSQAIADALLLNAVFVDAPTGFGLNADGYSDELRLAMNNECDAMAGMSLQPNSPLLEWATFTRAYAEIPFVFAVTDASYNSLNDIPKDRTLGTALGSVGESAFITYQSTQSENQRWRRLPYADPRLMLTRLLDGTLGGILLWGPALSFITDGDPAGAGVRIVPTDPMPASNVSVGLLLSAQETFLRSQMDQAIGSLIADGTLQGLMEEYGIVGTPGAP